MVVLNKVFRPVVADRRDLREYVISVTLLSWLVALTVDGVNRLINFVSWADCLFQWSLSTVVVVAIAVPIARSMGRAHLELFHAKKAADRLGRIDPLTGLANRRAFYEAMARQETGALALVIADIDRFKRVNDRFGHAAGDEVIRAVAARMQEALGDLGMVARVGGEEFALVCANVGVDDLTARLQCFRRRVAADPVRFADQDLFATVSVGFVVRRGTNLDELYAAADKALYAAKAAGRDRIVDFDEIEPQALPVAS